MRNDFESNYLAHYGILGMKWGVRRYQNPDGTLTEAGKRRIAKDQKKYDKLREEGRHLSDEVIGKGKNDADNAKRYERYRKHQKKYYKNLNKLESKYDLKAVNGLYEFGNYKITGFKEKGNDSKGLSEGQKKAIKIGAAVAGTALAAYGGYKLSKYIKTEAGKKIVAEGNKKAAELMKKAGQYRNMAGSAGNLPGQMHRHMLFTQKAVDTENQAAKLLKDTVDKANSTSSSLKKSLDYLKNDAAKSAQNVPTLKFGESTQKFTKADQDRLAEISNNLFKEAQKRNDMATNNTTSFDYAKELIKKNRKSLNKYTMQDLKDLDLY